MLVILIFKHNQLSVTKLVEDNTCKVSFFNGFCIITSTVNDEVKGVGKSKIGLYYLQNELMEETLSELKRMLCVVKQTHQIHTVTMILSKSSNAKQSDLVISLPTPNHSRGGLRNIILGFIHSKVRDWIIRVEFDLLSFPHFHL